MKFTREAPTAVTIRSLDRGTIKVGETVYSETVAVSADGIVREWHAKPIDELSGEDFLGLFDAGPEVIILGTGQQHLMPPRDLVFAMARSGIGFEVMHTAAAARTFNVLVGEGRLVAAVLYI